MPLELISFKICPFAQRVEIMLLEKGIAHGITYIDIKSPPAWFSKISPLGKVPLLRVNDVVLFESTIISEYIDDAYPPSLHPSNPLLKAQNRDTIELVSGTLLCLNNLVRKPQKDQFHTNLHSLNTELSHLNDLIKIGPYFNGTDFSLVDMAVAPLLQRIALVESKYSLCLFNDHPKLQQWWRTLAPRGSVHRSVVDDFDTLYLNDVKQSGGYFAQYL